MHSGNGAAQAPSHAPAEGWARMQQRSTMNEHCSARFMQLHCTMEHSQLLKTGLPAAGCQISSPAMTATSCEHRCRPLRKCSGATLQTTTTSRWQGQQGGLRSTYTHIGCCLPTIPFRGQLTELQVKGPAPHLHWLPLQIVPAPDSSFQLPMAGSHQQHLASLVQRLHAIGICCLCNVSKPHRQTPESVR